MSTFIASEKALLKMENLQNVKIKRYSKAWQLIHFYRPPDKTVYLKINFLISQLKHMLWVLKRTVSMRRSFWAPKANVKTDG